MGAYSGLVSIVSYVTSSAQGGLTGDFFLLLDGSFFLALSGQQIALV